MKSWSSSSLCAAALATLLVFSGAALAQQKTAKQCNEEWKANKAEIQASGKKKTDFIAECRGTSGSGTSTASPGAAQSPRAAGAEQKTAKQCNEEWKANKAEIQAGGKKKKDFIAECRGTSGSGTSAAAPGAARSPSAAGAAPGVTRAVGAPAGAGEFATEAQASAHCPGDTVVWANLNSKVYHFSGSRDYGNTKKGAYMCERDTTAAGFRAAKNEKHP
jgi:hypothetical protein